MSIANGLSNEDLPNSPHARQLRAGFPWLTFGGELEAEFRRTNFDENLLHTRVNLCLAILIVIAFSAMDAMVLGPQLDLIPSRIYILAIIPLLLIGLASSFSPQRHRIHAPLTMVTMTLFGLSVATIQIIASLGGISMLTPSLILSIVFIYFMSGLIFYHAVAANVIVADDDAEARRLFTSVQQAFTNVQRGRRGQLPPPIDDIEAYWTPEEKHRVSSMLRRSFVGSPETVRSGLEDFVAETGADELIIASAIHDHAARLRSYELLAS